MTKKPTTKTCKYCKSEIPYWSKVCPNCKNKQGGKLKWIVIAVVVLIIIESVANGGDGNKNETVSQEESPEPKQTDNSDKNSKEIEKNKPKKTEKPKPTKKPKTKKEIKNEYIKSCKTYGYKKVLRNPDKYIGKKIKIRVRISSVHEKGFLTSTKYYFAYSKGNYGWYGDEYAIFDKRDAEKPKLLEDDIIEVYGEIAEPEETTSLILSSQELFCINMKYVKLISE